MRRLGFLLWAIGATFLFAFNAVGQTTGPWTTSLGAGLALTSGNSDSKNINVTFTTLWDPKAKDLFKGELLYLRGDSEGETTVDKLTGLGRYEHTISERTFAYGEVSFLRDPFKEIDSLIAPMVGAGYYFIKTDAQKLSVDGGVGGIFEQSSEGSSSDFALKAGQAWERALSATSKVTERVSGRWNASDFNDAFYHFDAGVTAAIAARADLKVSYNYDYDNQPPSPDVKKGDSAFVAAVVFKF